MSIVSWLKSWLERRRLDDEDFQEEIRAHLAIAPTSEWPTVPIPRARSWRH